MRLRTIFFTLACALALPSLVADEFKEFELKNGTIYKDVPIINETATHYIVTIPEAEGKTIRIEKEFAKTDVKRAIRPTPEELDYRKLKRFFLTEDRINHSNVADFKFQTERFLKKYPQAQGKAEIDAETAKYDDIIKHLDAGDVKYKGEWISKAVQDRLYYTITSSRLLDMMKARAAARDYRNALNFYERLTSDFPASEATVEAEKMVYPIAVAYERFLKEKLQKVKKADADRQKKMTEIGAKNPAERAKLIAAYNQQLSKTNKEHTERVNKEREAGVRRWIAYNDMNAGGIETALYNATTFVTNKKRDMDNKSYQPPAYVGKGDAGVKKFWELIDAGDYMAAREQLTLIRSYKLPEKSRAPMDDAIASLQEKYQEEQSAKRKAVEEKRLAEIEKKAAERKAARERERKAREEKAKAAQEKQAKMNAAKKAAEEAKAKAKSE